MHEERLYRPILRGSALEGWRLYRIEDTQKGRNPFDMGGIDPHGIGVGLEVKVVPAWPAPDHPLPWSQFERHQIAWLREYAAEARALVALYSLHRASLCVYQITDPSRWRAPSGELAPVILDLVGQADCRFFAGWGPLATRPAAIPDAPPAPYPEPDR